MRYNENQADDKRSPKEPVPAHSTESLPENNTHPSIFELHVWQWIKTPLKQRQRQLSTVYALKQCLFFKSPVLSNSAEIRGRKLFDPTFFDSPLSFFPQETIEYTRP